MSYAEVDMPEPQEGSPSTGSRKEEYASQIFQRMGEVLPDLTPDQISRALNLADELAEQKIALESLAVLDSLLTDFFRHGHFLHLLDEEVKAAETMPQPSSALITVDLDFLKQFNDRFGHPAGDELLKAVGVSILRSIRRGDTPGRVGGDELAVIQRRTTIEGAVAAARRIQAAVLQSSQEKFAEQGGWTQTVSIGVCLIKPGLSAELLRNISDRALYASKKAGRNRISIGEYDPNIQTIKTVVVASKINSGSK